MSLYLTLRARLLDELKALYADLPETDFVPVVLERPREASHGLLATNAAMVLTKKLGKNPRMIADELVAKLKAWREVKSVEIAGPGFINMFLHDGIVMNDAMTIDAGAAYAAVDVGHGLKTIVEYVSINPTGPIHVGHGRNAVFGEAIARLLTKAHYNVHREYLMNDAGGQIRVLVRSLHARYLQEFGVDVEVPSDGYPGDYLVEIAKQLKAKDGDKWLQERDEDVLLDGLREFAVDSCMNLIRKDLDVLGIKFDRFFSEYEMHQTSNVMAEGVAALRDKGLVYEGTLPPPKGKEVKDYVPVELTLFKASELGLPEDQAIYNRKGAPTYFGQDIGYHFDKWKRGFRYMITVIGIDQSGSFTPLRAALEALTEVKGIYQPVTYEMVKVMRDGEPVRMSKRAGNFVLLSDVLEEVGADAFRFHMLTVKPTTLLVFDLAQAVSKTMDNPVFYVQYAHARLASVQRQAKEFGIETATDVKVDGWHPTAVALAEELMFYPLVVEQSAKLLEPHRLVIYARELAAAIHRWYADERWVDPADEEGSAQRLALVQRAKWVLADVLDLCAVCAPEQM